MGSGASSSSSVLDMTLALPTPEDSRNSACGHKRRFTPASRSDRFPPESRRSHRLRRGVLQPSRITAFLVHCRISAKEQNAPNPLSQGRYFWLRGQDLFKILPCSS